MKTKLALLLSLFLFASACMTSQPIKNSVVEKKPYVEREFRAAWVATVANINWPSKPGLPTAQQKAEAITILDSLQLLNFNAVIFQVRPQCDALYKSNVEPWSYYLTGKQGQAPKPYYDPLSFWIAEAHKRGIELHAWLNPYRAHHIVGGPVSEHSIVNTKPHLVYKLSSGYYWLDPSLEETRAYSLSVVKDIISRYDVDGIHFDDYFYPYPSYHNGDFPDEKSWQAYRQNGGKLTRSDWRREGVNIFVKEIWDTINEMAPHVKFGLSPFGIWRPNHPASIKGFDQHEKLYADAKLWLNEGWIDYFTPQLYWSVNKIPQSYPVLLGWWQKENSKQRHLWPGISIGRFKGAKGLDETFNQIMITRAMVAQSPGNIHWSYNPLKTNDTLATGLLSGPYKKQALPPVTPWKKGTVIENPVLTTKVEGDSLLVEWEADKLSSVFKWVVHFKYGSSSAWRILPRAKRSIKLPLYHINRKKIKKAKSLNEVLSVLQEVRVTASDRLANLSGSSSEKIDIESAKRPTLEKLKAQFETQN